MNSSELRRRIYWVSVLLLIFVAAFVISVIFLNPSSVGNRSFVWFFNLWASVWALIFLIVLVLTFALARNVIKLFFEQPAPGVEGRIQRKLILTFVIFSLFPALIMAFLAFGLINQNLRRWVSAPSELLLESAAVISEEFYRLQKERVTDEIRALATRLEPLDVQERVAELAVPRPGTNRFALASSEGQWIAGARDVLTRLSDAGLTREVGAEVVYRLDLRIDRGGGDVADEGVAAVALDDGSWLVLSFDVPRSVAFQTAQVRQAADTYRGVVGTLGPLRMNYLAILGLTMLAVVFGFIWLGRYIARRLTGPLEALADGSHELAKGNLDYQVKVETVDELQIVVDAFNRMASQLRDNRLSLERANSELIDTNVRLDERREYIETVLQNIATAVLTVDEGDRVRTANEAALNMFRVNQDEIIGQSLDSLVDKDVYRELQQVHRRAALYGTSRTQLTIPHGDQALYVAATMTRNSASAARQGEGFVLVLDDLTELITAEKFAAWQEVARRLAHEIKNPLTPIQLSAERLKKRFAKLDVDQADLREFGQLLDDSIRLIVAESEMLKTLVDEFSHFARLPIAVPAPVDLNDLVKKTLARYDGALASVELACRLDPAVGEIQADPQQIQRAVVNLVDNSLAALADVEGPRRLVVSTRLKQGQGAVCIEVADTGPGIPSQDYEHLFLPYFSTKKKGTGLGLAIVRQIVLEHGGFVRAEPNEPKGSRFVLELPVNALPRAAEG